MKKQSLIHQKKKKYLAAGFDDKGIPILPEEVNRKADSSGVRLGKGQKME